MPEQPTSSPQGKKLLDVVRDVLRTKHYSYRTEQTYVDWITCTCASAGKRYILFHQKRHPKDMGAQESIMRAVTVFAPARAAPSPSSHFNRQTTIGKPSAIRAWLMRFSSADS